jgi:hypothetical protein
VEYSNGFRLKITCTKQTSNALFYGRSAKSGFNAPQKNRTAIMRRHCESSLVPSSLARVDSFPLPVPRQSGDETTPVGAGVRLSALPVLGAKREKHGLQAADGLA